MSTRPKKRKAPSTVPTPITTPFEDTDRGEFLKWYMGSLTSAFGEELDSARRDAESTSGTALDVSRLAEALRTGAGEAVFDDRARKAAVLAFKTKKDKKET